MAFSLCLFLDAFFIFLVKLAVGCRDSPWQEGRGVLDFDGESIFGSEANLTCEGGFAPISGSFRRVCQNNGRWSGDAPVCAGKKFLMSFSSSLVLNSFKMKQRFWSGRWGHRFTESAWSPTSNYFLDLYQRGDDVLH